MGDGIMSQDVDVGLGSASSRDDIHDDDTAVGCSEMARTGDVEEKRKQLNQSLDEEGIALLAKIFPDSSVKELEHIHCNRLESLNGSLASDTEIVSTTGNSAAAAAPSPGLSRSRRRRGTQVQLPDDFLTIPPSTMVLLQNPTSGELEWRSTSDLEAIVMSFHSNLLAMRSDSEYQSIVFQRREIDSSLGMTIRQYDGSVCVHALAADADGKWSGCAFDAGVRVGDEIVGINGVPVAVGTEGALPFVAEVLRTASTDPIVLHLLRAGYSDGKVRDHDSSGVVNGGRPDQNATTLSVPSIHPLATVLVERGILPNEGDDLMLTRQLEEYTDRTQQWESTSRLCVDLNNQTLRTPLSKPGGGGVGQQSRRTPQSVCTPSTPVRRTTVRTTSATRGVARERSIASPHFSTPSTERFSQHRNEPPVQAITAARFPGQPQSWLERRFPSSPYTASGAERETIIEVGAIRKTLCTRILNMFSDSNDMAYTIWVYDVETETEWYAPVRYLQDFDELRVASIALNSSIEQFPYPAKASWLPVVSDQFKETRRKLLERFLRSLCAVLYTLPLHPNLAEVAIHLQSFLGCDTQSNAAHGNLMLHHQTITNSTLYDRGDVDDGHSEDEKKARVQLASALKRYVYRIFLLPSLESIASNFVETMKREIPTVTEMRELERKGIEALKDCASTILGKTQRFIESMQHIVLEGCTQDMLSIAEHVDYVSLRERFDSKTGELYSERLFRTIVLEYIEVEVYIPLRYSLSQCLVNAWRHDDMSLKHKIRELQKRPLSQFSLKHLSQSGWESVIDIIKEGVGRSSLPSMKLRAIVDASKEIIRLYEEEETNDKLQENHDANASMEKLGADDFLPILVYCVVMADLERPCALSALLEELCDKRSMLGETGYYLASFQGALQHIQEIPLNEWIE